MRRDTNVIIVPVQWIIITIDVVRRSIEVRVRVLEVLIDAIEKGEVMKPEVTITIDGNRKYGRGDRPRYKVDSTGNNRKNRDSDQDDSPERGTKEEKGFVQRQPKLLRTGARARGPVQEGKGKGNVREIFWNENAKGLSVVTMTQISEPFTNAIIDGGAQMSVISTKSFEQMKNPPKLTETFKLRGLGEEQTFLARLA